MCRFYHCDASCDRRCKIHKTRPTAMQNGPSTHRPCSRKPGLRLFVEAPSETNLEISSACIGPYLPTSMSKWPAHG
eukprot:scaffold30733_cov129-Isochrysis_galbana.AAC.4